MENLIMTAQLIMGFSILVIVHEWGHFIAARMFGIKVEKFFLFFDAFGVKLFSFKKGDTEYGIGWLPLGGYVKIVGMVDESMDKEFLNKPAEPYEFRAKPVWQRMIVILGGIIMNCILGVLIFIGHTAYYGTPYIPTSALEKGISAGKYGKELGFRTGDVITAINGAALTKADQIADNKLLLDKNLVYSILRVSSTENVPKGTDTPQCAIKKTEKLNITLPNDFSKQIMERGVPDFISVRTPFKVKAIQKDMGAEKAGILVGDKIVMVDSVPITYYDEFTSYMEGKKNSIVSLVVMRGDKPLTIKVKTDTAAKIGFLSDPIIKTDTFTYGFGEAVALGNSRAWSTIGNQVKALKKIISNDLPAKKSVSSIVGIAKAYGGEFDWYSFWALTGSLSMVLALMNFLPIPVLDGGYVVYLIIEAITGKPVNNKVLEILHYIGMALLFGLMAFALYNDLTR